MNSLTRKVVSAAVLLIVLLAAIPPSATAPDTDTDGDGLPDAWETSAGRAYGCDPRHADLLVYTIERSTMTDKVTDTINHATAFFNALNVGNPDGQRGIRLHVIRGPKTTDQNSSYSDLAKTYLPASLKGRAHFNVFSNDPGGQTNGNASISGVAEFGWNSFVHELGHQLGLNHEAIGFKVQSPVHASLMNYAYLDGFNGNENAIQFSDGRFASLRMTETSLDETLPFPIASLQFLANDPYRFAMKAVGSRTQVDWNRNGIFGEKGVRADINYQPSSWLGDRIKIEASLTAPAGAYVNKDFYVAYGVPAGRLRAIVLRKFLGGNRWGPRVATGLITAVGDPTLVADRGVLWVASQTPTGVDVVALQATGDGARVDGNLSATLPATRPARQPTLAVLDTRLVLFLHELGTNRVLALPYSGSGRTWGQEHDTGIKSLTTVGAAWHPIQHKAVIVATMNTNVKGRMAVYFRGVKDGLIDATGDDDWIGGKDGGNATIARPAVLVDTSRDAGPAGRVYAYYAASNPGLPVFFSMQVADKHFNGGWLERSAYDQWTITASAPAAVLGPTGEIAYCYRDQSNGMLNCSFAGSGVEPGEMGDADEVSFIRLQGLKRSLGR
ncbi:MAG TPA: hypothetical protein VGY48_02425 [Vicinamibacterales bacterium]|nr:hypothetical protein [Vicinamibacterales bacterium]